MLDVVLVVAAYAVGTFPTAAMVGRSAGHDPTHEGSGNPGASNVYRLAGRRAGALVLLGDLLKGVIAAGVGLAVGGRALGVACWVAATLGHIAPVTRGFRGGKGVATGGGGAIVLYPGLSVVLIPVFFVVARLTGAASLGSFSLVAGFLIGLVVTGRPAWEVVTAAGLSAVVIARHHENIRRLLHGEERSIRP